MKHTEKNIIKLLEVIKEAKKTNWLNEYDKQGTYQKGLSFGEYETIDMILNIIKNKESFKAYAEIYGVNEEE